ncbi:PREDICTED: uncharacterized protein LOC104802927 [Tarenaya hassleriana]|uniref:uncharacterized protein LOC104802927 n=1 Tax=Tarenaya hassleriana TaxID=28532 RepID=UPI00053C76E5|nr:PREDICTED: uncharacterized protein LOC104802927 [Tarenaya hassleriana]
MEEKGKFHFHRHRLTPSNMSCFRCYLCCCWSYSSGIGSYWCQMCQCYFHKECAESPLELHHHPYHPTHPLSLRPIDRAIASICGYSGEELGLGWAYHCQICDFCVHLSHVREPPALEVAQPKSHCHKLFLLPKPRPFTCDACGLMTVPSSLPWACLECGVMIHKQCMDLPRLIRISRHPPHRLCYVPSPPPPPHESSWSCGVCRKVVHDHYGAYSCVKDDCHYVVHSKCATRKDVWDGKDLEGEPEELEDVEEPFEVIDEKTIHHFSHDHHLKLEGASFDGREHCRICALPFCIHTGNIYSCTQSGCRFSLHETCANLSKKTWCMLHPHPLKLQANTSTILHCEVCLRLCLGFVYTCCTEDCHFSIDVNCVSVSEPLIHIRHPHPLFSISISMDGKVCSVCKGQADTNGKMMECIECDFNFCFKCITLPSKVRYKQDRHPLVLGGSGEEEAAIGGGSWWCEICEGKMEPEEEMYYTCDSCCVTVHAHCILGEEPYVKTGHYSFMWGEDDYEVAANISCCRPLCHRCGKRCPFPVVFKENDLHFCTLNCLSAFGLNIPLE